MKKNTTGFRPGILVSKRSSIYIFVGGIIWGLAHGQLPSLRFSIWGHSTIKLSGGEGFINADDRGRLDWGSCEPLTNADDGDVVLLIEKALS